MPKLHSKAAVNIAAVTMRPDPRNSIKGTPSILEMYFPRPIPIPTKNSSGSKKGGSPLLMRF